MDFWEGAVDVTEHLRDLHESRVRVERFTSHARQRWEGFYGDDPLILSLPGIVPATGACVRAYFGDGSAVDSAKKAADYLGITPSNCSSGTMHQARRAIDKEGPARLLLWPILGVDEHSGGSVLGVSSRSRVDGREPSDGAFVWE